MKTLQNFKVRLFALLLAFGILSYGVFEFWGYQQTISEEEQDLLAEKALQTANQNFHTFQTDFIEKSDELYEQITEEIRQSEDSDVLLKDKIQTVGFWGLSVFRNDTLISWSGFAPHTLSPAIHSIDNEGNPSVTIGQDNNVTFLSYRNSFKMEEGNQSSIYTILTRSKLQQNNTLSIGENAEVDASSLFISPDEYPVRVNFFGNIPFNVQNTQALTIQETDTVGIAYTLPSHFSDYRSAKQHQMQIYRAIFYALLILIAAWLLIAIAQNMEKWKSLFVKLFAVTIAWLFFSASDFGTEWIEIFFHQAEPGYSNLQLLANYSIHTIFLLIITITCFRPILHTNFDEIGRQKSVITILLILYGLLNSFLLYFFFIETYQIVFHSNLPVLDLEILPSWQTLILYISSGVWSISAIILLSIIGWFLLKLSRLPVLLAVLFTILGYLTGAFIIFALSLYVQIAMWIIISAGLLFGIIILIITAAYLRPSIITEHSRLRLFLFIALISTLATYIAVYKGYSDRLNGQLKEAARQFMEDESVEVENIARSLLIQLENSVSDLTTMDLRNRPAFIENFFIQQNRNVISNEWENFSISTQLIDNVGNIIAEYTTDLDTPAWTRSFNIRSLIIPLEEEQIRASNLRPIIRERPLNEANSNYSVFRRAWIPIFEHENPELITGWILCSVYREKPQFEKPLRAVIVSENNEDWNTSISLTEYVEGISTRRTIVGLPLDLPGYFHLNESLLSQINQNGSLYRITKLSDQKVREWFTTANDNQIIRAAANHPDFNVHLFSLLRLFFSILLPGLLLLSWFIWNEKSPLYIRQSRFRDRLIDRFIVASIICLIVLIGTTYYTLKNQNQKSIEAELLTKLENLAEALSTQNPDPDEIQNLSIAQFTLTLDADATLYLNNQVESTTTTQIYNQHILPRILPLQVYDAIYNKGNRQFTQRLTLGNQNLLQGYQPWLDENGHIAGVVSIPTFLEAPKFEEQLLATTSYLLIFFAVIFGMFILVASLISTQLTSPLDALQAGLRKISGGNLETQIPVKSDDEIGDLTRAYNVMVTRLKDLQEELAKAEREAAWKEMAQQVAHEIKNPLTPMKLNLQHLERQLTTSKDDFALMRPKIEKITANMIEQIESLSQIASDFSKFAKPTEQEFTKVEINELVNSVAELYEQEQLLTIQTDLHEQKLPVSGVKDELRRSLINLLKNAQEAMPDGGTITLQTEVNAPNVEIYVKDTGAGIPEESREHIFVPNFSTKSSGTGLGLAITKKIIQEHNGEISFTTKVGEGTTFIIRLPMIGE